MDNKTFRKTFKFICERCGEFSQTSRGYCKRCGVHAPREATKENYTQFELIREESIDMTLTKEKEAEEPKAKLKNKMLKNILDILPKITKNDEEYNVLLKGKRKGESVEDLIMQNRSCGEKLSIEKEQIIEEAIKLGVNEEEIRSIDIMIFNTKAAIDLCESMIDIETEMKDKNFKKKKKKELSNRYFSLLTRVVNEFSKLGTPFPLEESLFFQEPYISLLKRINALISPKYANMEIRIASQESLIRFDVRFNDPSLTKNEREHLKQKYGSLLLEAKTEFSKPIKPPFFLSMSGEIIYYKEPYISHFKSLENEYSLMGKGDPEAIIEVKKEVECMFQHLTQHREKLFAIHSKYLNQKENVDKIIEERESIEIKLRGELEFFLGYFFARRQTIEDKLEKFILKNLKSFSEDRNAKIKLQEDLSEKQKLIENIKDEKIFLDKIIEYTEILKDDTLNKEEKNYFLQEREKFRKEYKEKVQEIGFKVHKELARYIRVLETLKLMFDQSLIELLGKKSMKIRSCLECGEILYGNIGLCVWCGAKME